MNVNTQIIAGSVEDGLAQLRAHALKDPHFLLRLRRLALLIGGGRRVKITGPPISTQSLQTALLRILEKDTTHAALVEVNAQALWTLATKRLKDSAKPLHFSLHRPSDGWVLTHYKVTHCGEDELTILLSDHTSKTLSRATFMSIFLTTFKLKVRQADLDVNEIRPATPGAQAA